MTLEYNVKKTDTYDFVFWLYDSVEKQSGTLRSRWPEPQESGSATWY